MTWQKSLTVVDVLATERVEGEEEQVAVDAAEAPSVEQVLLLAALVEHLAYRVQQVVAHDARDHEL